MRCISICRPAVVVSLTYHKQLHLGAHFGLRCQLAFVPAGVLQIHILDLQRPAEAAAVAPLLTPRNSVGEGVAQGSDGRRSCGQGPSGYKCRQGGRLEQRCEPGIVDKGCVIHRNDMFIPQPNPGERFSRVLVELQVRIIMDIICMLLVMDKGVWK